MAELKPCGTYAAYRRHLRADEEPCEACQQAARDQKNGRVDARRESENLAILEAVADPVDQVDIDPLRDAIKNYQYVCAAMDAGDVRSIGTLSKRRQELVDLITELRSATTEVSLSDELAAIRSRREAGA